MRLTAALGLLTDLRLATGAALWPTILAVWHAPWLLFQPHALSRLFMSHVWNLFGNGVDEAGRDAKQALITPYAYGVVLDLGAGGSLRSIEVIMFSYEGQVTATPSTTWNIHVSRNTLL